MKKILFLHSGAELYGADRILLEIVTNINKEKFQPIVVLPNEGPLVSELKKNNIKVEIIPYPIIRRKYFNIKGILKYFLEYRKAVNDICEFAQKEEVNIIHNNTIAVLEGISIKRKMNIPLIVHIHEMIENPKLVAKILYSIICKNATKIIVVSNAVKEHINKYYKKEKAIVVHNGIDIKNYSIKNDTEYLKKELNIPPKALIIGMIGRINAIKGQDDFVEVLNELIKDNNNIYGIIVGDAFKGQEWRVNKLLEKIDEFGIQKNVKYCGYRKDIPNIHSLINIYVLPSIKKDSFPTVVLESMASGKPIVAYKCGGVTEMVRNGENGYLVEMGNKQRLLCAIRKIANDENLRKNMGKESFYIVSQEFNTQKFIENFEKIYGSIK